MKFVETLQESWRGGAFQGEVIVAGGAFKPLLSPLATWNDIDLWVPDAPTRAKLDTHLRGAGFVLVSDFQPFCRAYRNGALVVEITYHDLNQSATERAFRDFDLSPSRIATRLKNGRAMDFAASTDFWECLEDRTVRVSMRYLRGVHEHQSPDILIGLHRLTTWAANLGWSVDPLQEKELWEEFESRYSPAAREKAIRLAWRILVDHKNCPASPIWARAAHAQGAAPLIAELAVNSS
jgi:hypothetical protein